MDLRRPVSLAAERAVRFLSRHRTPVGSIEIAREVLRTTTPDEATATRVLRAAFGDDPRLRYDGHGWTTTAEIEQEELPAKACDPDRVLLLIQGVRPSPRVPFRLRSVAAVRMRGRDVLSACGGAPSGGRSGARLRAAVVGLLDGAIPVAHVPPGAIEALERWLGGPLTGLVSLRRVARSRLGIASSHDLEDLVAHLRLAWRETGDLLDQAEVLDQVLEVLRKPGETLEELRESAVGAPPIDWSRFAFDRAFLRDIPRVPGTYRFYDPDGRLLYVGKSRNLHDRVASYFRDAAPRPRRVQRILDVLHRIEIDPLGSDLEAVLREAVEIRRRRPAANVQRSVRIRGGPHDRLRSALILEPASRPWVLRAYLLRDVRLVGKVAIGPRGAGLRRIERLLDDHFFGIPLGPTPGSGADLEVEVVSRWLGTNQDRVVAFDPTDLGSSREVIRRLRWFLQQGSLSDPEGAPILSR